MILPVSSGNKIIDNFLFNECMFGDPGSVHQSAFHQRHGNFDAKISSASPIGSSPAAFMSASTMIFTRSAEFYRGFPAKDLFGFFRVRNKDIDLGRAEIFRINLHVLFSIKSRIGKGFVQELADRMGFPGTDDEIIGLILLQDAPHAFDIFRGKSPVTLCLKIPEIQELLLA